VSKLSRWPRVYQDQLVEPETDLLLDDFDETIAADIESTRRGMKALSPGSNPTAEYLTLQNKLVDGLIAEMKEQRHELAKVVQSVNRKASKKAFEDFSKSMKEGTDKRLDSIRNWAAALIAAGGFAMALLRK
jgi:hypothetical protein